METRETTFYIGRLNIIYSRNIDKKTFLLNSFNQNVYLTRYKFEWVFLETETSRFQSNDFILGYLVKNQPRRQDEQVDREKKRLRPIEWSDMAIAKSKFILHVHSGLIAYNPRPKHIPEKSFRNAFAYLIEKANEDFLVRANIELLTVAHDFLKRLKSLDCIHNIKITLHPSNPNINPVWKQIDRDLKEMSANKAKVEYQGDLRVQEDSRVRSEIQMTMDGYGKTDVKGLRNHKVEKISTENTPNTVNAFLEENTTTIEKPVGAKLLRIAKGTEGYED